jgi:hypothetical protein
VDYYGSRLTYKFGFEWYELDLIEKDSDLPRSKLIV